MIEKKREALEALDLAVLEGTVLEWYERYKDTIRSSLCVRKNDVEKVVRDGMVAICYSPGFGAGWSTWIDDDLKDVVLFHPKIVKWVEDGKKGNISDILSEIIGDQSVYCGGAEDLRVCWLPEGTHFKVTEYDGSESVEPAGEGYEVA